MEDTNQTNDTPSAPDGERPALWKQLLGAVAGAGIALMLYQGYQITSSSLSGWLIAPQSQIEAQKAGTGALAADVVDRSKYDRVIARANQIYNQFAAEEPSPPAEERDREWIVPEEEESLPVPPVFPITETGSSAEIDVRSWPLPVQAQENSVASMSSSSSSSRQFAEAPKSLSGKNLPNSGIGLTLAVVLAGAFTGRSVVRRKRK